MPRKSDTCNVGEKYDRRRKLTEEQKDIIREEYTTGLWSHRTLAKKYGVSKSCISIILNDNRANAVKQRGKEHWRDYQKHGEERNATIREHRKYKKELYERGLIK